MGKILDELRREYAEEEAGRKWYQRSPRGDVTLYLNARMRDAEVEAKDYMELAHATELAAIDILRRYDPDGSLVMEFKANIQQQKRYL